jgi:predicted MFS family arabinose efflux permease
MKRSLSFSDVTRTRALVVAGTALIAGTYGMVRLAWGLFLPDVQASTGLTDVDAGRLASAASVAYCVAAVIGLGADHRPRLLVVAALTAAGGGALATALAPGVVALVVATVVASMGAGFASPALVGVVRRNLAPDRRPTAQSVVNSGTGPGLVLAGALALGPGSWRTGFAISALATASAGVAVLLLDRPRGAEAERPASQPARPWPVGDLVVPTAGAVLLGVASAAVWTFGRSHLVASGAGTTASVVAWIALGAGGTATVLTARLLAGLAPPRAWLVTTTCVAASTAVLGTAADLTVVATLACAAFGWAFVAATSALIGWAALVVPDRAAGASALLFVAMVAGQAVGSWAAGAVGDASGWPCAFLCASLAAVAAAATSSRALPGRTG